MAPGRDQHVEPDEPAQEPAQEPGAGRQPGAAAGAARPPLVWRVSVVLVFALAGTLFWTARDTANGQGDIRQDRLSQLPDLIRSQDTRNKDLTQRIADTRTGLDALTRGQSSDSRVAAAQQQVDRLSAPAALTPVSGSALTVTLNDAPADYHPAPGAPTPQQEWLIIHQQDVQAVVNALWSGGATAIQVMDQRIVTTSAVRCVGNTLILQGRVYSPPYTITAVGDPTSLQAALDRSKAVGIYLGYVNAYGLGWKVEQRDGVTLPGYTGPLAVSHATVVP